MRFDSQYIPVGILVLNERLDKMIGYMYLEVRVDAFFPCVKLCQLCLFQLFLFQATPLQFSDPNSHNSDNHCLLAVSNQSARNI